MKLLMKKAGAGVPSANRITLLRDTKGTGTADTRTVFLQGLNSPFGMVLVGNDLYVACTDAIVRFPYTAGATQITPKARRSSTCRGHDQSSLDQERHRESRRIALVRHRRLQQQRRGERDGERRDRAAILEVDLATRRSRVYASGLRNPNGLGWQPQTGALWTVVNERDELGSDLVPDYLTSVKEGAFYGWPYSYFGQHVDERVKPPRPDLVASAIAPDYALGAHVAPLGMTFYDAQLLPPRFKAGRSSASTARGTGARSAGTRSSSCRSRTDSRAESRKTCSRPS
jgi:glucose/arabinose dehydrogenase